MSPVGGFFAKSAPSRGVSLLADPMYIRAWPGGVGDHKVGANYGPTIHVQNQAISKGLQQVLWLYGPDHQVTEVGTMNVFLHYINEQGGNCRWNSMKFDFIFKCNFLWKFKKKVRNLITPPLNGLILPGITRDSILHLARQWNECNVIETTITMAQVCKLVEEKRVSLRWIFNVFLDDLMYSVFSLAIRNVWIGYCLYRVSNWTNSVLGKRDFNTNNGTRKPNICPLPRCNNSHSIRKNWTPMGRFNWLTY